ncbi:sensor histidine kinase [Luteimonas abyssi]|uniref:sensor histidine kinase n=1 Tax=Luteimonas abyssi TaxID=1247514 RepID=UPI000737B7C5|nr:histidine kinase [Luteimonas abyssi]
MPHALRTLLHPMHLAALCALAAVGLSLRWLPGEHAIAGWLLLFAFAIAMFVFEPIRVRAPRVSRLVLAAMPILALALVWLHPRIGTPQVLLVIWAGLVASFWSWPRVLPALLAVNAAQLAILVAAGHAAPLTVTLLYLGFQGFAALTAHYLRTAEDARDALARVNADLLATRALLADSARDGERLRVARELHDIAGHKLTALTLNLRALAAVPGLAARPELMLSQRLSSELLGDIRDVVQAIRDARGFDLATALRALAAPFPRPRLVLEIDDDVRVADPGVAEAILRMVQEALTNSARHANARTVQVRLAIDRDADALQIAIEDDGRLPGPLQEGNGLAGMRERIANAGGELRLSTGTRGALRIDASLPA